MKMDEGSICPRLILNSLNNSIIKRYSVDIAHQPLFNFRIAKTIKS